MPPRGRGAQSDEVKKQNFDNWTNGVDDMLCKELYGFRKNLEPKHELKDLHPGSHDITGDWQPVLTALFKLVESLKVPGRKAKCKLQNHST